MGRSDGADAGAASGAEAGSEARVAADAEAGAVFESRAAVAAIEAGGVFSGTGEGVSERGTDCGAGVGADTACVSVEGTCAGPEAGDGARAAAGWGVC